MRFPIGGAADILIMGRFAVDETTVAKLNNKMSVALSMLGLVDGLAVQRVIKCQDSGLKPRQATKLVSTDGQTLKGQLNGRHLSTSWDGGQSRSQHYYRLLTGDLAKYISSLGGEVVRKCNRQPCSTSRVWIDSKHQPPIHVSGC